MDYLVGDLHIGRIAWNGVIDDTELSSSREASIYRDSHL